jgi:hypothetical protein
MRPVGGARERRAPVATSLNVRARRGQQIVIEDVPSIVDRQRVALIDTRIPTHLLPLRYNYPNQPEFDLARSGELESIRFLHFLRSQIVQREADFATMETIEKMAARTDLAGSNELFRRRFAELLPSVADAGLYSNKQDVR